MRTKPLQTTEQITLTECAVLGMLARKERSGYDLLKAIERSVGFFWTPAKSQLYALLPKLVERGLLEARRIEQDKRPDKTVYRITTTGRAALREGLEQASPAIDRNPFELRVFFGEHMRPGAVRKLIESRRDGRSIIYTARYDYMSALLGYLVEDCCGASQEICAPLADVLSRSRCQVESAA